MGYNSPASEDAVREARAADPGEKAETRTERAKVQPQQQFSTAVYSNIITTPVIFTSFTFTVNPAAFTP